MQTVDIKGKKWAIKLEWEVLGGNKSVKTELKEAAISNKCQYGIVINQGLSDNQVSGHGGKLVGVGFSKQYTNHPSAVLYLALANDAEKNLSNEFDHKPDWIVIEEMPDDKYWMAVISRSIPLPGTDEVLDKTMLIDKVNSLLVNDIYKIYSTSTDIRAIYDGEKEIIPKGLNELTEDISTKIGFKKLTGIPNHLIYAGFGLMVFAVAILGVQAYMDSSIAQKQREEAARIALQEQEAKRIAYEQELKKYEEDFAKARSEALNNVLMDLSGNPNKLLNAFYEAVGNFSLGSSGWNPKTIACEFNPILPEHKAGCTITFDRTGLSTNRMLLQDFPDAVISGNTASVRRNIIADNEIFKTPNLSFLDTLPTAKSWGFDMISQLQLLKLVDIDHKVTNSSEIFFSPPAKPLSDQERAAGQVQQVPAPISIGISKGQIELNSDNFLLLREVADNIDFTSVGVETANFSLNGDKTGWKVVMDYFVKNGEGSIGESGSAGLPASNVAEEKPGQGPNGQGQGMGNSGMGNR